MGDVGDRTPVDLSIGVVLALLPALAGVLYTVRVLKSSRAPLAKAIYLGGATLAPASIIAALGLLERVFEGLPDLRIGLFAVVLLTSFAIGVVMTTVAQLPRVLLRRTR